MIEFAILKMLLADDTVSSILGTRLYANQLPQESVAAGFPAACYRRITSQRGCTSTGPDGSVKTLTTFFVVGSTISDVQVAADAIRMAINGYRGTQAGVIIQSGSPDVTQDVRIGYVRLIDERDAEIDPIGAKQLSQNERQLDFECLFWEPTE